MMHVVGGMVAGVSVELFDIGCGVYFGDCWTYLVLLLVFFFNDTATTEIYTLSLHDALPIYSRQISFGSLYKALEKLALIIKLSPIVTQLVKSTLQCYWCI